MQLRERRAGSSAELGGVAEVLVVHVQCVGLVAAAVEREHALAGQPLVERVFGGPGGQLGQGSAWRPRAARGRWGRARRPAAARAGLRAHAANHGVSSRPNASPRQSPSACSSSSSAGRRLGRAGAGDQVLEPVQVDRPGSTVRLAAGPRTISTSGRRRGLRSRERCCTVAAGALRQPLPRDRSRSWSTGTGRLGSTRSAAARTLPGVTELDRPPVDAGLDVTEEPNSDLSSAFPHHQDSADPSSDAGVSASDLRIQGLPKVGLLTIGHQIGRLRWRRYRGAAGGEGAPS